jgi:RNA polymerase sigma-70 factor (ECF subfamily)
MINGDDARLLERLRRDERDAMAALYDSYGRLAYGLAYRIVGEPREAEDVVQESFLALWRQAGRLDPARGSVRSYLLTIVQRRAVDVLRRRAGRPERALDDVEVPGNAGDPLEQASLAEQRANVRRALNALPPDQRQAVELTYFAGLTIREMADKQSVPLGTAKSRLRLALERLRTILEPQ